MQIKPIQIISFASSKANMLNDRKSAEVPISEDNNIVPFDVSLLSQRYDFHISRPDKVNPQNRTYDSFTKLRDKNYLLAFLNIALQEAQRENRTLSVAMFDMDDFKSVNELLGYEVGDIFIKEVSRNIFDVAKESDLDLYRFGGEEFILIFNNQTAGEMEHVAQSVVDKISNNETILSYQSLYLKNAQRRLDNYMYLFEKVQTISELKTKRETLEDVIAHLSTPEAKNDPYFRSVMKEITMQIDSAYRNLISECLRKEQDEKNRSMLLQAQTKMLSGRALSNDEQEDLDEYLYSIYDKAHEIYQTKKWISNFKQHNGFGITCAIVNFEPESLEYKGAMDVIDMAGKVLKKGKNRKKGRVYRETIAL